MSETTNLKLFKHDNPSTNTNPFDVEQSLNENWDKIDTEIGNIRENINGNDTDITDLKSKVTDLETNLDTAQNNIDEIKQEQITQNKVIEANTTAIEENTRSIEQNTTDITKLQEDNAKLKAQIPTGTAAGEEISLSDSAEMELVDFGLQGNSKQETREGYNLYDYIDRVSASKNGLDISVDKKTGYINVEGTANANYISIVSQINISDILDDGETYSIWQELKTSKYNDDFYIQINIKPIDGSVDKYISAGNSSGFNNFKVDKSKNIYNIGVQTGSSKDKVFSNVKNRFMLLKGTETKEFELYGASPSLEYSSKVQAVGDSGSVEIVKSNKNVLDFGYQSGNGITFNKNGVTILNPTGYLYSNNNNISGNKFLSGKTINFSFISNGEVTGDNNIQFIFHTNKKTYVINKQYNKGNYTNEIFTKEVVLADDEVMSSIQIYTAGTTANLTIDVQVEISDEATDFIEHKGDEYVLPIQKPFYKLGDYADKFIKQNGKWYEQHNIALFDLSTTNWYAGSVQSGKDVKTKRWNSVNTISNYIIYDNEAISNYFSENLTNVLWGTDKIGFNLESNKINIRLPVDTASNETEVKNFWQEKAETQVPYIYYRKATPELIECTSEQTQILEQIVKDGTYKGITHFYTTDDLKPTIELTYYKDLETLFKNQAEIQNTLNNVQAQILELGG